MQENKNLYMYLHIRFYIISHQNVYRYLSYSKFTVGDKVNYFEELKIPCLENINFYALGSVVKRRMNVSISNANSY